MTGEPRPPAVPDGSALAGECGGGKPGGAAATLPPLLALSGVGKSFASGVVALRDVELTAEAGQLIVIMGPSGSGKSTLLHLVAALDHPTSGRILVDGVDVASATPEWRTRHRLESVGFVFQSFNLLPAFTLRENIELPLVLLGKAAAERRARVAELATALGISGCVDRFPHEVSGGQQQRAAVARALSGRPRLLVADEPTATLDTANARAIFDLVRQLVAGSAVTALVATHDTRFVAPTDRVLDIQDGILTPRG